jgi:hypothetical protein
MSHRAAVIGFLGIALAAALLWSASAGMLRSVYAQADPQGTPYPVGVPAEVGDGWTISIEAATLNPSASDPGSAAGQPRLTTTLRVQNTAPEPRRFPTYRLRVVNGSGAPQRDTWCGRETNPLELSGRISPTSSQIGTACWALSSADVSNLVLYVDAPPSERERQPETFALTPTISTVAPAVPTSAVAPLPLAESPAPIPNRAAPSRTDPMSSWCSPAYSMYAGSSGNYAVSDCVAGSYGGSGAALWAPGVPACQLYPSARQPSASNSVTNGYGASLAPVLTPTPGTTAQAASSGVSC